MKGACTECGKKEVDIVLSEFGQDGHRAYCGKCIEHKDDPKPAVKKQK